MRQCSFCNGTDGINLVYCIGCKDHIPCCHDCTIKKNGGIYRICYSCKITNDRNYKINKIFNMDNLNLIDPENRDKCKISSRIFFD